jgi:hypothetical protein
LEWRVATTARSSKPLKAPKTLKILSPKFRSDNARKAALVRWGNSSKNRTLKKFLQSLAKNYIKQFGDHPALLAELVEPLTQWADTLGPSPVTEEEIQHKTTFLMEGTHHA